MVDDERVIIVCQRACVVGSIHMGESLAAANRGNDLDFIPIDEDGRRMLAPGDDLPVALDGDALAFEGKTAAEIGTPRRGYRQYVGGAVYRNGVIAGVDEAGAYCL